MSIKFICPDDSEVLQDQGSQNFSCAKCGKNYPIHNGVLRLLKHEDEFYEGRYDNQIKFIPKNENFWNIWPLWLINSGYLWLIRKYVPANNVILELGCAGGVRYLGQRYQMIGCDLSFSSLKKLDGIYGNLVQADACLSIPLPVNSVDAIVSTFFWEHIPEESKIKALFECHRVLKDDGVIIFLYDVETMNPLISRYKNSNLKLYNELFIDSDGHIGYQSPTENLNLFKRQGFKIHEHHGLEKTWLQSASTFSKLAKFGGFSQRLFKLMIIFDQKPWYYFYTVVMRLVDTFVCPFLPKKWARIDLIVAKKVHFNELHNP